MHRSTHVPNELTLFRSYVVRYDSGFAPCVADGICSLACCKPVIRRKSQKGDWILGTTPTRRGAGKLVYLMCVDEVRSFEAYYRDRRLRGRYDNIYRPDPGRPVAGWHQCPGNSRYLQKDDRPHSCGNIEKDLGGENVLLSHTFAYFGNEAPKIPSTSMRLVKQGRNHAIFGKSPREQEMIRGLADWVFRLGHGRIGRPADRPSHHTSCARS
jgi:hypothetical protein